MPITKEFREFFLRDTQVNTGAKRDQEVGYAVQTLINGTYKYNRLLQNHYPTEDTFTKLLESIAFKLNPEDTATTTVQGLAKKATDAEAIAKTATYSDSMTRFVEPAHLPTVIADTTPGNVAVTVTADTVTVSARDSRRFKVKADYTPPTEKIRMLENISAQTGVAAAASGSGAQTIKTYALPANTVANNTDILEVETVFRVTSTSGTPFTGQLKVMLGSATLFEYLAVALYTTELKVKILCYRRAGAIQYIYSACDIRNYLSQATSLRTYSNAGAADFTTGLNIDVTVNPTGSAVLINEIVVDFLTVKIFQK